MALKFPIYLDYHSTTPIDPVVLETMMPYLTNDFGNPSSKSHCFGWKAEFAIEKARESVAKLIGAAQSQEIVFTSGATESNNFALKGIAEKYSHMGKHILTSQVEHKSTLDTAHYLEKRGFELTYLPVDSYGKLQFSALEQAIRPDTILLSVMLANNETGTINEIKKISEIARKRNILLHTDAAQAVGKIPINVDEMGVDLLSLSGHKMYAPKGVGALYVRRKNPRVELEPLLHGGGQEHGLRAGTLNVPGIIGLGKACEIAQGLMSEESARISFLRDKLHHELNESLGEIYLNGHPTDRLPQSLNLSFPFIESDSLVASLKNIAVSSTSACMSAASIPSYVLAAMGASNDRIHSSVRFGLGRYTTEEEIVYTAETVTQTVKRLQKSSPLYQMKNIGSGEPS